MKGKRIIWGLVSLVTLAMIAVSFGATSGRSQRNTSNKPQSEQTRTPEEFAHLAVVDFDAPEIGDREEREKRREKSKRYDDMNLVIKNPDSKTGGTFRFDEIPPPPAIPVNESEIVVIGETLNAAAYLSNDKGGVYSEFTVRIEKVFKNSETNKVEPSNSIIMDRTGGCIQYPNGQKVIYALAERPLPFVGKRYILFLDKPDESPNFNILTAYELKDSKVYPLELTGPFLKFKGTNEKAFITTIEEALTKPSPKINNQ